MKKSAALVLTLLMMTSSAYAYENAVAGFSIKTKNPMVTIESQKFYGFTDVASNEFSETKYEDSIAMHVVNYFNAEDMEKIVGEKFSTAYFNKQYEKLALLQHSELNLKTLPIPLMDFEKYSVDGNSTNLVLENYYLKKMLGDIERHVSIEKYGKNKGITSTSYIKQAYNLTIDRTTAVSVNDKLYMLSTTENYPEYFLPAELKDTVQAEDAAENSSLKSDTAEGEAAVDDSADASVADLETVGDVKKIFKVENVNPAELDQKITKAFDKKHNKFVKSVKFSEPVGETKKLSYYEAAFKKDIVLPDDWFYAQTRVADKDMDFNMTMSASVPMMQKLATNFDVVSLYSIFVELDEDTPLEVAKAEVGGKAAEELIKNAKSAFTSFNSMLMTGSITSKDKEFKQEIANLYAEPESAEFSAMMFLDDTFSRLHGFSNEYITLEDYNYAVKVGNDKAKLDMNVGIGLFKELRFENSFRVASSSDSATFLWLLRNKKADLEPEITKIVDQWQF